MSLIRNAISIAATENDEHNLNDPLDIINNLPILPVTKKLTIQRVFQNVH